MTWNAKPAKNRKPKWRSNVGTTKRSNVKNVWLAQVMKNMRRRPVLKVEKDIEASVDIIYCLPWQFVYEDGKNECSESITSHVNWKDVSRIDFLVAQPFLVCGNGLLKYRFVVIPSVKATCCALQIKTYYPFYLNCHMLFNNNTCIQNISCNLNCSLFQIFFICHFYPSFSWYMKNSPLI